MARHFATKRELLALIDALAALKLNRLHLHLTDDQGWRIESRLHPQLHEIGSHRSRTRISLNDEEPEVYEDIPHGGYYTLADLAEIAALCGPARACRWCPRSTCPATARRCLPRCPSSAPGPLPDGGYHVSPDWGIFPNLLAPLPGVDARPARRLRRTARPRPVLALSTSAETSACSAAGATIARIDAARRNRGLATAEDLHAAFLRDVADMLAADFAARAVVWDEGFSSAGGRAGMLRPDTVVMAWRGMQIARQAAAGRARCRGGAGLS